MEGAHITAPFDTTQDLQEENDAFSLAWICLASSGVVIPDVLQGAVFSSACGTLCTRKPSICEASEQRNRTKSSKADDWAFNRGETELLRSIQSLQMIKVIDHH